ncbi:MAG: hypothetical protein IRZ09_01350 [Variibacter sp.]|nr:hypothetical protein [Variibacter sp.]
MKVADAIVEILRREGVDTIIGYPVNHILERGAAAGIRPVIVRQERTDLHMADAISRVTSGDKLGVFAMPDGETACARKSLSLARGADVRVASPIRGAAQGASQAPSHRIGSIRPFPTAGGQHAEGGSRCRT